MRHIGFLPKQPSYKIDCADGIPITGQQDSYWMLKDKERTEIDVPIVQATLKLIGYGRGRSSAIFHFEDEDGNKFDAAMKESERIFMKTICGEITDMFTFKKQGSQVSISLYEKEDAI